MYRELNISEADGVLAAFNAVCELKEETERLQAECAAKAAELAGLAGLLARGKGKQQDDTDPEDDPNKPKKKAKPSTADDAEPVSAARTDAPTDPAQEWLAPIKQKFLEARKAGASMADLKQMLLTMHPNTKALAKAFANNILAGFAGEGEEVDAAKEKLNPPIPQADGTNCHTKNCGRHKGTTREVKTSPLPKKQTKEQDRGNIVYRDNSCHVVQYKDGRMEVHVYSSVTNENDAKKAIEKLISQCREKRKGQMRGKPDFGYIAPGEHVEFFVSSQTINESVENDFHIKRSDNKEAHYTAASVIDKLWETSQEGIRRKPKKDTPKDDEIKWVHERYATLKIRSQKYRVKITAFEYKKSNNDNLLYDIMVQKKR